MKEQHGSETDRSERLRLRSTGNGLGLMFCGSEVKGRGVLLDVN